MPNAFTKPGYIWSEIVCEIEWLQDERGDLSAALAEIEDQLGSEYWESEALLTVTVSEGVAELIREVENIDGAERAELDRRQTEGERRLAELNQQLTELQTKQADDE